MSKNKLKMYTLWYNDKANADKEIEKEYGMTIEELQRVCKEKLEKLGCTKQTIDSNIDWDEFLRAVYLRDDYTYWSTCNVLVGNQFKPIGVFGDFCNEMDFVTAMTTD